MRILLILATVVGVTLTACSSPSPSTAPSDPATGLAQPSTSSTVNDGASRPANAGDPAASVKSYGVSSPECTAASDVLQAATKFGLKANMGSAKQADFESAYTGTSANSLPVDALPTFAALKTASLTVVGLNQQEANQHVGEFSLALGNFVRVTEKICS